MGLFEASLMLCTYRFFRQNEKIILRYFEESLRNGWDDVAEPPLFTGFQALHQTSSP